MSSQQTGNPLRRVVRSVPGLKRWRINLARKSRERSFAGSADYWDRRYAAGGNSGPGSYGEGAGHKACVVNAFVADHEIRSVVEFGCGDGAQLSLANYPSYLGLDVSEQSLSLCRARFANDSSKSFALYRPDIAARAELSLSIEVIFHLVENDVFEAYMKDLFQAAERFVVICSTDNERPSGFPFMRHRRYSTWVAENVPQWTLFQRVEPQFGVSKFSIYRRGNE